MVDIELIKKEVFCMLDEVEADMKTLSLQIMRAREALELAKTVEELRIFDERCGDLEENLVHIRLC